MANDKGTLLPNSTKASSDDDRDSNDLSNSSSITGSGSIHLSARHLPPVYVDIQEEIENNIDEIKRQSE